MNLLFACHRFPFPPNRGGKIRPFHFIQHLSRTHSVTVASLAHSEEEMRQGEGLKDHCQEVLAEVLPSRVRWTQAVAALPTATPSSVAYFYSARLMKRVREAAARKNFDAVMVHCAFAAQYALDVPAALKILDYGDLDAGKWMDYSQYRAFPMSLGYGIEARKLRRYEKFLAHRFHRITVTTAGEMEEFQTFAPGVSCTVIPNGVDFSYFQPRKLDPASRIIVFLGRMDYYPNVEGIVRFTHEVLPNIRRQVPEAALRIVGANPTAKVQDLAKIPGVTVTGFVKDVRPYLDDAAVAIAPLLLARGTQNKILECMAMGIPVVSSPQAAKGIRAQAGRHLAVAASPEAYAAETVRLLSDPVARQAMADTAREHLKHEHRWDLSMTILDEVIAGARSGHPLPVTT